VEIEKNTIEVLIFNKEDQRSKVLTKKMEKLILGWNSFNKISSLNFELEFLGEKLVKSLIYSVFTVGKVDDTWKIHMRKLW
jgi:hypothetical protein